MGAIIISVWKPELAVDYERTDLYVWERRILKNITNSGVYVYRDKNDEIIYIGEAQNLSERVGDHLTGKNIDSALYDDDGFTYAYKVELYRLQSKDAHRRFLMEIEGIQRLNPIFNRKYRADGTIESREIKRKEYLRNNEKLTWKYWNLWQVKAYLEGDVLTDLLLEEIWHTVPNWDLLKKETIADMIKVKHGYSNEQLLEKLFSYGTGVLKDSKTISPPTSSFVLGLDTNFKTKYKEGQQRIYNMINEKKAVGTSLAPTSRQQGDKHKPSMVEAF
jgi:hypothetical protein